MVVKPTKKMFIGENTASMSKDHVFEASFFFFSFEDSNLFPFTP